MSTSIFQAPHTAVGRGEDEPGAIAVSFLVTTGMGILRFVT